MKKLFGVLLSATVFLFLCGNAIAQGRGKGKPASTGVEHAESTANSEGVSHGIENAETKQATHKDKDKTNKGKHKGKGKGHKHHDAPSH